MVDTATTTDTATAPRPPRGIMTMLAIDRLSGIYATGLLVLFFTLQLPGLFFTEVTFKTELASVAITGILAIGILVPMVAGMFDLSFASLAGLSLILVVWLSAETTYPEIVLALIAIGVCLIAGVVNGFLVAYLELDSLVVTLAMSSVLTGLAELVTKSSQLYGIFTPEFESLGRDSIGPFPYLFLILLALALGVWVWLEHTTTGRYALAVGSNPVASRLAGINVRRIRFSTFLFSSLVAGVAGVLLAAQIGIGATTTGPGFLLPTIAAVFLGATQVKGRVNVVGTLIALLVIGTGIKGLQLWGAEPWVTNFFNGAVLLLAITAGTLRTRQAARRG